MTLTWHGSRSTAWILWGYPTDPSGRRLNAFGGEGDEAWKVTGNLLSITIQLANHWQLFSISLLPNYSWKQMRGKILTERHLQNPLFKLFVDIIIIIEEVWKNIGAFCQ